MTISSLFPLLSEILVFILSFLIFIYGRKRKVGKTFLAFLFFINIWMFGTFMMFLNKDNIDLIIFWDKIVYAGVVFIPVAMLGFGFALINKETKSTKILIYLGYFISLLFLLLVPGDYLIKGANVYSWGGHSRAGIFHNTLLLFYAFYLYVWFSSVLKYYLKLKQSTDRERIKYSLIAFIQFTLFGLVGFLPAYGINIYPVSYISGLVFAIIITYAIISYRLMDIKLVLRQSSVYILSLITAVTPPIILKYLATQYFPQYAFWFDIVLLIIAISLFPVVRGYFYKFANKYLFTSLYDSKELIAGLSEKLRTSLEAKKIYGFIAESLTGAFHSKAFAVLNFEDKNDYLTVDFNQGFKCDGKKIPVDKKSTIYTDFVAQSRIIVFDELQNYNFPGLKQFIAEYNKKLGAEILVPLAVKDKVIGLIALGAKESGDVYNSEDIDVLRVVSSQVAIALENANLYEETKDFNIKLIKEVERATKELKEVNEELRKLDQAKSDFISIASHQLRTPLTVIKGYVSMMLEGSFGEINTKVDENLYKVYESNERLIHLVENLLNISRIESGRLQYNFEQTDLVTSIESVVEEMEQSAKKKKLYLTFNKPRLPISKINLDEEKIRQVIINVIDNSIKYTKNGGITVKLEKQDNKARCTIADTGIGISKEDLSNLFKKFSRGTDTSLVHTEGTGLGLYVGKMMIEAHQGKIWAESAGLGRGTRFIFEIPLKIKQPDKVNPNTTKINPNTTK